MLRIVQSRQTFAAGLLLVATGCGTEMPRYIGQAPQAATVTLSTLSLSTTESSQTTISVKVCAGSTGAPHGFSLQWMTAAAFEETGGWAPSDDTGLCKASFSGTPQSAINRFSLQPGACTVVEVGNLFDEELGVSFSCNDDLQCGTEYVFRAFAHAGTTNKNQYKRSPFSTDLVASTLACSNTAIECTLTQGYWKTHHPGVCAASPESPLCVDWPVESLTLGTVTYTVAQLVSILEQPAAGNGLVSLAHQLIAAKLNVANGADGSSIEWAIAAADALIGELVIPPVGSGALLPKQSSLLTGELDGYNTGATGPGHCD